MDEPLDFDKKTKLYSHREKQKLLTVEIEEVNKKIKMQLDQWEKDNNKQIAKEKIYNLPEDIQKLIGQYNYNVKTLRQKYLRYIDQK